MGNIAGAGCGSVWGTGFSWSSYWANHYKARVSAGGGTIIDNTLLSTEIKYVVDNNLVNKILYWVDKSFGVKTEVPSLKVPLVSFSFDDGYTTDYGVYQHFVSAGIGRGTSFLNTKYIGGVNYQSSTCLTWNQIAIMLAGGWDFQCHSYSHGMADGINPGGKLTALTTAQIEAEIVNSTNDFLAHGLSSPQHLAYPVYEGDFDHVLPICAKYRKSMRAGGANWISPYTYKDQSFWSYTGPNIDYSNAGNVVIAKVAIDNAILTNEPIHLASHSSSGVGWLAGLDDVLAYVYSHSLVPNTVSQHYTKVNAERYKLFNVIEGSSDGSLKDYTPIVYYDTALDTDKQDIIIFNDTLANIGTTIADHYVNMGYRVKFWIDSAVGALAYDIPNTNFRTAIIAGEGAANVTPKALAERTTTINYSSGAYGGNLTDCGMEVCRNLSGTASLLSTGNAFTGGIPKEFNYLGRNLTAISFLSNQLSSGFGNLLKITGGIQNTVTAINVGNNLISEVFPFDIADLVSLTILDFYNNLITGTIPISINKLKNLTYFRGYLNLITDYTTGAISTAMTNLVDIRFYDCSFTDSAVNKMCIDVRNLVAISKKAGILFLHNNARSTMGKATGDPGDPATGRGALYQLQNAIVELGAVGNWNCLVEI